eukprot:scaffold4937_cov105-Isochrysis_galbana.AAC.2
MAPWVGAVRQHDRVRARGPGRRTAAVPPVYIQLWQLCGDVIGGSRRLATARTSSATYSRTLRWRRARDVTGAVDDLALLGPVLPFAREKPRQL